MNDGTTPLILAAKHAILNIVKDLIKAGAKVNSTDNHGNFGFVSLTQLVLLSVEAVSGSISWLTDSFSFQQVKPPSTGLQQSTA